MASNVPALQDDERFALMKFRRQVADVLKPEHDDYYLLRWLRARSWNPEAAEKMLRESMKFRERWNADEIDKWPTPQILIDLAPHGVSGFDREGSPIIIIPFAGFDIWGLLHTVSRADIVRMTLQALERYMKLAYEQSQKMNNPNCRQFVVIFDMENFNLKQYVWRPASEVVISLIKMYEANYPEILKCCYIINAPKVFAFAYNMVKKFLGEYTIDKIKIYKSDRNKWLPAILDRCPASQIPKYFGGTMTDEDGNPKCEKKLCWGGKVPKSMYTSKEDSFNNNLTFTETEIKKGGKLKLVFDCEDTGCFLKWEFRTFDHDIKFGIKCTNKKTQENEIEVPLKRVASHQVDESGFITCQPGCTYSVLFDNSYSYFKTKKIRYSVLMTTPLSEIEQTASAITITEEAAEATED
ncbi:SEC14-like protein 2 [Aedes albopictus]|uniref:Putative transport n=2 Tax=Aedes albopictus TaxID=7160 RepID=A0A023ERQ7_AEDAL|nr:SEC14-like protein 2 [Aedes albopictus]XP_029732333.1 SEC14-like protein 2 [Aedes albopictus]XP_029732334.1 SEC14-like protein 2 isoform X1 [Aedes albopictus]XP_029732335.1 SEC14-like protein 2 isoform X1 [Aedes albopictus]XP_029732336.1 SEC14-like protein 2 isoform X1 [Aedes albopictus]XP_029732338.1 SEC14-like protein 2 isoform X2 [Aedes albopictus]